MAIIKTKVILNPESGDLVSETLKNRKTLLKKKSHIAKKIKGGMEMVKMVKKNKGKKNPPSVGTMKDAIYFAKQYKDSHPKATWSECMKFGWEKVFATGRKKIVSYGVSAQKKGKVKAANAKMNANRAALLAASMKKKLENEVKAAKAAKKAAEKKVTKAKKAAEKKVKKVKKVAEKKVNKVKKEYKIKARKIAIPRKGGRLEVFNVPKRQKAIMKNPTPAFRTLPTERMSGGKNVKYKKIIIGGHSHDLRNVKEIGVARKNPEFIQGIKNILNDAKEFIMIRDEYIAHGVGTVAGLAEATAVGFLVNKFVTNEYKPWIRSGVQGVLVGFNVIVYKNVENAMVKAGFKGAILGSAAIFAVGLGINVWRAIMEKKIAFISQKVAESVKVDIEKQKVMGMGAPGMTFVDLPKLIGDSYDPNALGITVPDSLGEIITSVVGTGIGLTDVSE